MLVAIHFMFLNNATSCYYYLPSSGKLFSQKTEKDPDVHFETKSLGIELTPLPPRVPGRE